MWHNPEQATGASRAPGTRGSRPSLEYAPPGPQSRASGDRAHRGASARSPGGFPGFRPNLSEPPGAPAPFVSGVGAEGQKMSP